MGRALTATAITLLVAGCGQYEADQPWNSDEVADTDDGGMGVFEIVPIDDDEPGDDDGATAQPHQPAPRACDPEHWTSGWAPAAGGPVLQSHMSWESAGLRPSQIVEHDGQRQAWYVGQTVEHCTVGTWAATCLVGRVGRADEDADSWSFMDDWPAMDLWNYGLSVRRLFVQSPELSSAGRWDAWLALEGIEYDSEIYWASSADGQLWTVRASQPALMAGDSGSWDSRGVSDPSVWTQRGSTSMLYTGFEGDLDRPQIGLAQLTDQGWLRSSDKPVLSYGEPGRHDSWGVLRPSLLVFDDCLVMFHQAIDEQGTSSLSVATSTDGRNWTRSDRPVDAGQGVLDWHDAGEYDPVAYMDGDTAYLLFNGSSKSGTGGVGWLVSE